MSFDRLPRTYQPRTVPALLARRADRVASRIAIVGFSDRDSAPVSLTFETLYGSSIRVAAVLALEYGVTPGSRVAWLASNHDGVDAVVLYHAIAAAGAVNVPLNPRLAAPEVAAIAEHAEISLLVHTGGVADRARKVISLLRQPLASVDLADLIAAATGRIDPSLIRERSAALVEDDIASILYTSGTTGRPKGVVHSHHSSLAAGIGWADAFRLLPDDVYHSPFPVFSGAGLHFMGLAALWAGATNVVDSPVVGGMLDRIERLRSTVYAAVPTIFQDWLDDPTLSARDLTSLRLLDYGGATMPLPVILRLRRALPQVRLMQTYGLTEAGPGGLYLPEEYAVAKLGSIGNRGAGGFTAFRAVTETGEDTATDEVGELLVRGPSVMVGYFADMEATALALGPDGWLRTGDLVRVDDQGFVFHVDRKKDIIIRGGFNIGSAEVESVLLDHPSVLDAAVVGRPHVRLGEEVVAAVVLREGRRVDEQALITHCAQALADFKVPRAVMFVSELPRNASGKVLKHVLRADAELWAPPPPPEALSPVGERR